MVLFCNSIEDICFSFICHINTPLNAQQLEYQYIHPSHNISIYRYFCYSIAMVNKLIDINENEDGTIDR